MPAVEISREYALGAITIASGAAASSKLNITRFAFGSVQLPAAIDGTLKWQVSIDETNWTDSEAISFAANGSLKIPDDVWSFPAARILASSNQSAARTFLTFCKG